MRGPLSLRINDGSTDKHVTANTSDLRFKRTAYGGDVDLSCRVSVPTTTFTDLGPGDTLTLYDTRNGQTVWAGDVDNPGTTTGPAGQSFDVQAFGGAARLQASKTSLGYVVRSMDIFHRSANSNKGGQTRSEEVDEDTPGMEVYANEGKAVGTGWQGEFITRAFKKAGRTIARVYVYIDSGVSVAAYRHILLTGTTNSDLVARDTRGTASGFTFLEAEYPTIPNTATVLALRADRITSSTTGTDDHWFRFYGIRIMQSIVDKYGVAATHTFSTYAIKPTDAINDMLGRGMAPGADPAKSTVDIEPDDYGITPLDWLDGITMGDAMHELRVYLPALYWTLSGDVFTAGQFDEATPRYVIGKGDGGITKPGQEFSLCNRIHVSWVDDRGNDQTEIVTATVDGLDYTRDANPIAFPDGQGESTAAIRVGGYALSLANDPPKAGTAVIRRKIRDQLLGVDVLPHEILPGATAMEQETGDIYWLTEVEYVDADGAAVLTLGDPRPTVEQSMARERRRHKRRRRN